MTLIFSSAELFKNLHKDWDAEVEARRLAAQMEIFAHQLPQTLRNLDIYDYGEKYTLKVLGPVLELLAFQSPTATIRPCLSDAKAALRNIIIRADWHLWTFEDTRLNPSGAAALTHFSISDINAMADAREKIGKPAQALRNMAGMKHIVAYQRTVHEQQDLIREVFFGRNIP